MNFFGAILMAVSLCADCFAVSLCSSVTLKEIHWRSVGRVALAFAVIQSGLLSAGWAFGSLMAGFVDRVAHIIGFLLLLYVGGGMVLEGWRGEREERDLNGWKNIILGGVATSIDALAAGAAQSMSGQSFQDYFPLLVSVAVITAVSVVTGIYGGKTLGSRFGRGAEIAGGLVLIGIGISVLI